MFICKRCPVISSLSACCFPAFSDRGSITSCAVPGARRASRLPGCQSLLCAVPRQVWVCTGPAHPCLGARLVQGKQISCKYGYFCIHLNEQTWLDRGCTMYMLYCLQRLMDDGSVTPEIFQGLGQQHRAPLQLLSHGTTGTGNAAEAADLALPLFSTQRTAKARNWFCFMMAIQAPAPLAM
ncbi:uncharacterized protein [Aphelocoma coerulescens]|uniref:uncharacterized protein isoform X3 n=1 Tax=Aphelocoma coerulescens TaxID=39617 RepID=UPI003604690A